MLNLSFERMIKMVSRSEVLKTASRDGRRYNGTDARGGEAHSAGARQGQNPSGKGRTAQSTRSVHGHSVYPRDAGRAPDANAIAQSADMEVENDDLDGTILGICDHCEEEEHAVVLPSGAICMATYLDPFDPPECNPELECIRCCRRTHARCLILRLAKEDAAELCQQSLNPDAAREALGTLRCFSADVHNPLDGTSVKGPSESACPWADIPILTSMMKTFCWLVPTCPFLCEECGGDSRAYVAAAHAAVSMFLERAEVDADGRAPHFIQTACITEKCPADGMKVLFPRVYARATKDVANRILLNEEQDWLVSSSDLRAGAYEDNPWGIQRKGSRKARGLPGGAADMMPEVGECMDAPPCHPLQIRAVDCELLRVLHDKAEGEASSEGGKTQSIEGVGENIFVWVHLPHIGKWRRGMVLRRLDTSGARLGLKVHWGSSNVGPTQIFSPYTARMCWENLKQVRKFTAAETAKRLSTLVRRQKAAQDTGRDAHRIPMLGHGILPSQLVHGSGTAPEGVKPWTGSVVNVDKRTLPAEKLKLKAAKGMSSRGHIAGPFPPPSLSADEAVAAEMQCISVKNSEFLLDKKFAGNYGDHVYLRRIGAEKAKPDVAPDYSYAEDAQVSAAPGAERQEIVRMLANRDMKRKVVEKRPRLQDQSDTDVDGRDGDKFGAAEYKQPDSAESRRLRRRLGQLAPAPRNPATMPVDGAIGSRSTAPVIAPPPAIPNGIAMARDSSSPKPVMVQHEHHAKAGLASRDLLRPPVVPAQVPTPRPSAVGARESLGSKAIVPQSEANLKGGGLVKTVPLPSVAGAGSAPLRESDRIKLRDAYNDALLRLNSVTKGRALDRVQVFQALLREALRGVAVPPAVAPFTPGAIIPTGATDQVLVPPAARGALEVTLDELTLDLCRIQRTLFPRPPAHVISVKAVSSKNIDKTIRVKDRVRGMPYAPLEMNSLADDQSIVVGHNIAVHSKKKHKGKIPRLVNIHAELVPSPLGPPSMREVDVRLAMSDYNEALTPHAGVQALYGYFKARLLGMK